MLNLVRKKTMGLKEKKGMLNNKHGGGVGSGGLAFWEIDAKPFFFLSLTSYNCSQLVSFCSL